eukprot:11421641-Alexandrium_andersonii.AAC.1
MLNALHPELGEFMLRQCRGPRSASFERLKQLRNSRIGMLDNHRKSPHGERSRFKIKTRTPTGKRVLRTLHNA